MGFSAVQIFFEVKCILSVADSDRVTKFLETLQNFQNWMKLDKNLIYISVFFTQNLVKSLPGSVTAHGFDAITIYIIFNLVFQTDSF